MPVINVKTAEDFDELQKKTGVLVTHFQSEWAPQCKQISDVITELSGQKDTEFAVYVNVDAEELASVSLRLSVTAVPTVVVTITRDGEQPQLAGRVDGAKPGEVATLVKKLAAKAFLTGIDIAAVSLEPASITEKENSQDLNDRLKKLINSTPCVLFMKGSPTNPKCGFSRTTVELLAKHNTQYSSFDILTDDAVRQGLKTYSNWPTYPQLYLNGNLIGGLDILKEMDSSGDLTDMLPRKTNLDDRLKVLINQAPLMVFMKGTPDNPRCGFSRTLMQILKEIGCPFDTFDILTNEEVRQGLKTYSNWPTYPQVYLKGELLGGLDIIKEMQTDGSLQGALQGL